MMMTIDELIEQKRTHKRKDLRGCAGCHDKLLAAGKAAMRKVSTTVERKPNKGQA